VSFRSRRLLEAKRPVEAMGICGGQRPASESAQVLVRKDGRDEELAQSSTPVVLDGECVGEVGVRRTIGDQPTKPTCSPADV